MIGTALYLAARCAGLDAPPAVAPGEFRMWFDAAREGTLVVPEEVCAGRGGIVMSSSPGSPTSRSPAISPRTSRTSAPWG